MSNLIDEINAEQMQREIPEFAPGDIVTVIDEHDLGEAL